MDARQKVSIRCFPDGLFYFFLMSYPTFKAGKLIFVQQLNWLNSHLANPMEHWYVLHFCWLQPSLALTSKNYGCSTKKVSMRFFPDGLLYFFSMTYPTFNAGKLIFIQHIDRLNSRVAGTIKIYKSVNFKAICKTFPSKKVFLMYPTCQFCHTCN